MTSHCYALIIAALVATTGAREGLAATFEKHCVTASEKICGLRMSGEIISGDYVKFLIAIGTPTSELCGERKSAGEAISWSATGNAHQAIERLKKLRIEAYCAERQSKSAAAPARKVLDQIPDSYSVPEHVTLFLNSPGQGFHEGMLIAHEVLQLGIRTAVWEGDECDSACALVFIAGSYWWKAYHHPCRLLHSRGRLRFHAPFTQISALQANVRAVYATAIQDAATLGTVLGSKSRDRASFDGGVPWMRPELFIELLGKGPGEFVVIDTIDNAARFNIMLAGLGHAVQLTPSVIEKACFNFRDWRNGLSAKKDDDVDQDGSKPTWKSLGTVWAKRPGDWNVSRVQGNGGDCFVRFKVRNIRDFGRSSDDDLEISINERDVEGTNARRWASVPIWTMLEPRTMLSGPAKQREMHDRYCSFNMP